MIELGNFTLLWLCAYALTVAMVKTSFMAHFLWPILRLIGRVDWDKDDYKGWQMRMTLSEDWRKQVIGDFLQCRFCLSFWAGVVVASVGVADISPLHGAMLALAWAGLTDIIFSALTPQD